MKHMGLSVLLGLCTLSLGAQVPKPTKAEAAAWEKVKTSRAPKDFEAFLAKFPNGGLAVLAKAKLVTLKQAESIASEPADPAKVLLRDKLETREEFAARIAGLGPLPVGKGRASVDSYDVDNRRLDWTFEPEPWATAYFRPGRLVLEVDRDQLKKWLAVDPNATLVARFEVREGQVQPVEVFVQSPVGPLSPAAEPPPVIGAERNAANQWETTVQAKQVRLALVKIPGGTFLMGTPGSTGADKAHLVTIGRGFWVGKFPVTLAQWDAAMGPGSKAPDANANRPKTSMSWNDAQVFIEKLNWMQTAWTFRLPTEAEWEYACRGGTEGAWYGDVDAIAWYAENSGKVSHPVGEKLPNAYGLYDMVGNVWQWCQDRYADYPAEAMVDPHGPESGELRVTRGGSWNDPALLCRSAYRSKNAQDSRFSNLGVRVVAMPRNP